MKDWIEIKFWQIAIGLIKSGYGADCETKDYEDFADHPHEVTATNRCASCRAREVIDWINHHIELIKL